MKFLNNDYTHLTLRLLIGAIFVYSAVPHVLNAMGLASSIYNYRLFPSSIIGMSAAVIPWITLLSGLALILGVKVRAASLIISISLVIFICLAVISMIRGLDIDCGCFIGIVRKANWLAVSEDLLLLLGSLYTFFFDRTRISLVLLIKKLVLHNKNYEGALL